MLAGVNGSRGTSVLAGLAIAASAASWLHAQTPAPPKNPLLRLAQPWPDAVQMKQRKADAEALRLFKAEEPVAFTLAADFRNINRDRDPNSRRQYPAQLTFTRDNGQPHALSVKLNARGHVRRMARTCDYVPLRIEFPDEGLADTLFDGQDALKLVVQCRGSAPFEQYLLREYLVYRVFNTLTPRGFRGRLAKIAYLDAAGKPAGARYGMLLEDDGDVAKRMEGRTVDLPRALFDDLEAATLDTMMMFEYMIGSTDLSIYALHNVVLVQTTDRKLYPVPYDFDMTGLVSPPYAIPDRRFPIKSVKERLYRGPCRTLEQLESVLTTFRERREQILALPETIPDLSRDSRGEARSYLESFYNSIREARDVKRLFVDGCQKTPAM
jgi:hypothetical protein